MTETVGTIDFINRYPWQWWATLNLSSATRNRATELLKQFARKIGKAERVQVGCLGVVVDNDHGPHLHLFMFGYSGKTGRTLAHVRPQIWEKEWCDLVRQTASAAKIIPLSIADIPDRIRYCFAGRNLPHELIYYGKILQKREMV